MAGIQSSGTTSAQLFISVQENHENCINKKGLISDTKQKWTLVHYNKV